MTSLWPAPEKKVKNNMDQAETLRQLLCEYSCRMRKPEREG